MKRTSTETSPQVFVEASFNKDEIYEVPWADHATHGEIRSLDDAVDDNFTMDDVVCVIAYGGDESAYSGAYAGLALLSDGRFLSWESWSDATGSGFHHDAYGGDQEVMVSTNPITALRGIPENRRSLLVFATHESERALVEVLYDAHLSGHGRDALIAIARASGEFHTLVEFRVDELRRRWPEPL